MSWSMWTIDGIGFSTANVDMEHLRAFVKAHEEALKESRDEDFFEAVYNNATDIDEIRDMTDNDCIAEIVIDVMNHDFGEEWTFDAMSRDDYDEESVLFCPAYPWNYKDKQRSLTREKIIEFMEKYRNELGVEHETGELTMNYSG